MRNVPCFFPCESWELRGVATRPQASTVTTDGDCKQRWSSMPHAAGIGPCWEQPKEPFSQIYHHCNHLPATCGAAVKFSRFDNGQWLAADTKSAVHSVQEKNELKKYVWQFVCNGIELNQRTWHETVQETGWETQIKIFSARVVDRWNKSDEKIVIATSVNASNRNLSTVGY